ncbi:metal-dependent hydrolase [Kineosporia sp. J2-2]|uniref:Metal-dependent hydrolase n=1 Tax=Kineosporia corallincola TaxID=2835133 RepID=A0ABS5TLQ6_9ACTN|nr:metal-dependent hydrolase [Kineosporia corallincola]MBT0772037.1 metal-dependent hydrolase [Kineosporia corallincola]
MLSDRRLWWLPVCCWLAVVVADVLLRRAPSYFVLGLVDEPAHFLTSVVVLLAVAAAVPGRHLGVYFSAGLLVSGNLIDLDHLPMSLGTDLLTAGTARPYPHSLVTPVVLLAVAVLSPGRWSRLAAGAAIGVTGHLLRDLGTAPVSLFWPFSGAGVSVPHGLYLGVLLALALVPRLAGAVRSTPPSIRPAPAPRAAEPDRRS